MGLYKKFSLDDVLHEPILARTPPMTRKIKKNTTKYSFKNQLKQLEPELETEIVEIDKQDKLMPTK